MNWNDDLQEPLPICPSTCWREMFMALAPPRWERSLRTCMPKPKKRSRADAAESSGARSKKLYSAHLAEDLRSELRGWPKPDRTRVGKLIQRGSREFRQPTFAFWHWDSRPLAQGEPAQRLWMSHRQRTAIGLHVGITGVALFPHHRQSRRSAPIPKIVSVTFALSLLALVTVHQSRITALNSVKGCGSHGALRSRLPSGRGEALRPSFLLFFPLLIGKNFG